MRLFGFEIAIRKAAPVSASAVADNRGWLPLIVRESFQGAWQRNTTVRVETALAYHAVFSCVTLIAQDVGKLRTKLVKLDEDGIWSETTSPAFSPVLARPNRYQNHIQFKETWITSKLVSGNTYILKVRDERKVVVALYILDPSRVTVLVAPDGSVYYQLGQDNLSGLQESTVTVPASEIIHDRMNCLFHPLVGVSPIYASGTAANVGLKIQGTAAKFFEKGSNPSGVLTAPATISEDTAKRLKEHWETQFSGDNAGAVAVLGEGLTWTPMRMTAVDAQLIQQLKWTAETVCSTFHVPPFKAGIGAAPAYPNAAETLNQIYYSDCLQAHIESLEAVLDDGLGLAEKKDGVLYGIELDLDALLRMDTGAQYKVLGEGIGSALLAPNEARRKINLKPVVGGNSPMIQQQNYSLEAIAKRDAQEDPFSSSKQSPPVAPPAPPVPTSAGKSWEDAEAWEALECEIDRESEGMVFGDPSEADAEAKRIASGGPLALLGSGKI